MRFSLVLSLFVVCLPAAAQVRLDFAGDGTSDLLYFSAGAEDSWLAVDPESGQTDLDEKFGLATDLPVPAYWLSGGCLAAVIRAGGETFLESFCWRRNGADVYPGKLGRRCRLRSRFRRQ